MPLTERDRENVDAFRCYIEDLVVSDDRYGPAGRHDREDESTLATRFDAGPGCWFEVALWPMIPRIHVGFLTTDQGKSEEIQQAIHESGESVEQLVAAGFADAGLDWAEPPVEHYLDERGGFYFATPLQVEDLVDLDTEGVRNTVLRMLEGYLIAFGPAIAPEEDE